MRPGLPGLPYPLKRRLTALRLLTGSASSVICPGRASRASLPWASPWKVTGPFKARAHAAGSGVVIGGRMSGRRREINRGERS